jgi:transcriptional regulator with XRE-family HTH domain
VVNQERFFRALGLRIKELRRKSGYSQEDMISFGFSARHWQQIEAGRPITVRTLLRIAEVLKIRLDKLVRGLACLIHQRKEYARPREFGRPRSMEAASIGVSLGC